MNFCKGVLTSLNFKLTTRRLLHEKSALLNQGMNVNCAGSRAKVSLALGFKNTRKEDSYLKSATPEVV
ncbi:MAG: hypothetical protein ACK5SD_22470 [Pseudanabaena sp.]